MNTTKMSSSQWLCMKLIINMRYQNAEFTYFKNYQTHWFFHWKYGLSSNFLSIYVKLWVCFFKGLLHGIKYDVVIVQGQYFCYIFEYTNCVSFFHPIFQPIPTGKSFTRNKNIVNFTTMVFQWPLKLRFSFSHSPYRFTPSTIVRLPLSPRSGFRSHIRTQIISEHRPS